MDKISRGVNRVFTAIVHKEDNLYVTECPEAGTASQGSTVENYDFLIRSFLFFIGG